MVPARRAARLTAAAVATCVALIAAGCGSGRHDLATDSTAAPGAPVGSTPAPPTSTARQAAPRWETVATLVGSGPTETVEFKVVPDAIQWRVRWTCERGTLRITTTPPPRRPAPIVDSPCPATGNGFAIHTGSIRLGVDTPGPWRAVVDQQVDTPLDEPLPPDVASAKVVAEGRFHQVEKPGHGSVRLYRLADGRRVLRFEDFQTAENTDLFVWLSEAADPKTSVDAVGAPRVVLGNLKSTVGNQNYDVPSSVPTDHIRSVVVWCEPVAIAYTAAGLDGVRG